MPSTHHLSKSKVLAGWQCHKRLWLEVHDPDKGEVSGSMEQAFAVGHAVGDIARRLFPGGVLIGHDQDLSAALQETANFVERKTMQCAGTFEEGRASSPPERTTHSLITILIRRTINHASHRQLLFGTRLLIACAALLLTTGFTSKFDSYCQRYATKIELCKSREAHYQKEAMKLRTWVPSDKWASCERLVDSYRLMEICLRRELGDRGPPRNDWSPPVSSPARDTEPTLGSLPQTAPPNYPGRAAEAIPERPRPTFGGIGPNRPSSDTFLGAAKAGDVPSLQAFLTEGQKIDEPLVDGKTALHYAAMWGRMDAVKFLIFQGANRSSQDNFGRTPSFYASERGYREIEELLK